MSVPFVVSPQGAEFLVNTTTAGNQEAPTITGLANGGFVVTWMDGGGQGGDTSGHGIVAQVFSASGAKVGGEFLVNTTTTGEQLTPRITSLATGGFVVTWTDESGQGGDTDGYGVKAQLFSAAGAKVGGEFLVNTATAGYQAAPTITSLANGGFVVAWQDPSGQGGDADSFSVKAQLFSASGAKVGGEFLVNTTTTSYQWTPAISGLANGGFVVTWEDGSGQGGDADSSSVKAQLFSASGAKVGGEFLVNTATAGYQLAPTVTGLAYGGFVVAWDDLSGQGGDPDAGIKAQVFNAAGGKVGGEVLVNTTTAGGQYAPTITGIANGGFVVSWEDQNGDASGYGIKTQAYDASGTKVGGEYLVNTATAGDQVVPTIKGLPNGTFVVAWTDYGVQTGTSYNADIKAQLYAVNQAPVIGAPTAVVSSDAVGQIAFSSASGTALTVADDNASLTTTLDAGHGTLTLSSSVGLTVTGNGSYHLVVTGSPTATTAALSGLTYQAASGYTGSDLLGVTSSDGSLSASATVTLSDKAVAPTAYVRSGGEFLVNTATTGDQDAPRITGLTNGSFVVTWRDASGQGGDADATGIKAQMFSAAGAKIGGEFLVNTTTTGVQIASTVTSLANGGFVVSWTDQGAHPGATPETVKAQVFSAAGAKVGGEFLVNTTTGTWQDSSTITSLANGGFVVTWKENFGQSGDASGTSINAQVFDASGAKVGGEFLVNTVTAKDQYAPTVVGLANGGFVAAWTDASGLGGDADGTSIKAQVFNASGAKVGGQFLVNTATAGYQVGPTITGLIDSSFVVAWQDPSGQGGDASGAGIKAQLFSAVGAQVGGEFLVNTTTASSQLSPTVTGLTNGSFVVTWQDASGQGGDADATGIKAQVFSAAGAKVGGEFLVNTTTTGSQGNPAITSLANGNFAVVWSDNSGLGGDASGTGIKAQIFALNVAPTLAIDGVSGLTNLTDGHTVSGHLDAAHAGLGVTIRDGSTALGTALSDAQGHFTFSLDGSALGASHAYALTAAATDAAGLTGTSATFAFTLDFHANQTSFGAVTHDGHAGGAVYALYDGLLGRTADALGLEGWAALIKGGLSLHDVAAGFLASTEGQNRAGAADNAAFVEQLYQANLHRASDPAGKAGWVHELDSGHMDRASVALGFALSDEHLNALAPAYQAGVFVPDQTTANVARLYEGVLGRSPDAGGLSALTGQVAHGTSLHDLAAGMLASTEYRGVSTGYTDPGFVAALYQQVLGRAGDAGGVANWTDYLAHGGARGTVIDGFTGSAEFQGHYAGQSSRDYVEGLYEHILNRTGDAAGLNGWAAQIDSHAMSRAQVAQQFTGSAEFQQKYVAPSDAAFVDQVYVGALGRHADAGGLASWTDQLAHGVSRADVAVALSVSPEAQAHHLADIEQGWHLV